MQHIKVQGDTALPDSPSDAKVPSQGKRLHDALVTARDHQAARFDAIEEVHALEAARLRALAEDLEPVFDEIPSSDTLFVCAVVPGDPPRLWIDMISYVVVGADGRTFKFVMNARAGRQTLAESAEIPEISGHVVNYIAHRLIDLERAGAVPPADGHGAATGRYSSATVALALGCGFAVGALALFAVTVMLRASGLTARILRADRVLNKELSKALHFETPIDLAMQVPIGTNFNEIFFVSGVRDIRG